jgi:uncharacterized protein (DUF58 family)
VNPVNPKLRIVILAGAALGFLGLLLVGGLVALSLLGKEVQGIEVALEAPASVRRGEAFPIRARVRNTAGKRQTLVDLDVGKGFNLPIEPGTELVLELQATGKQPGEFEGDFDFCINSSIAYVTQPLRTRVQE